MLQTKFVKAFRWVTKNSFAEFSDHISKEEFIHYSLGKGLPSTTLLRNKEWRTINNFAQSLELSYDYEFVLDNKVQQKNFELAPTSRSEPYILYPNQVKLDIDGENLLFFQSRNIPVVRDYQNPQAILPYDLDFDSLLHRKSSDVKLSDDTLAFITPVLKMLMGTLDVTSHEGGIQSIVNYLLSAIPIPRIRVIPNETIVATHYFRAPINSGAQKCIVDHVINLQKHELSGKHLLLCEDKNPSKRKITAAIMQNFDQLRIYADSVNQIFPKYYGAATTLTEWVFTCYNKRDYDVLETAENFTVSKLYTLPTLHKILTVGISDSPEEFLGDERLLKSEIEKLIRLLTCLVKINIDEALN